MIGRFPVRRVGRFVGTGLLALLVASLGYGVIGTFLPAVPYLSAGQLLTAFFGPWVVLLSLAASGLAALLWRRRRRRRHLAIATVAMFAAIGGAVIVAAQVGAIRASGVDVDLASGLHLGSPTKGGPAPVIRAYGRYEGDALPLAIYRPAGPLRRLAPVLVYVHGGGWTSGSYRQRDADMRWFADRGVLGVSVEYTLSTADRHLWAVTQRQIGCALGWIGANIARFGGDPARVAMIGESAGGNLVINVAYLANRHALRSACSGTPPHVSGVVALYPVIDVADFYRNDGFGLPLSARGMASAYTGGTPAQVPQRYAAVSSATHISAAAPATVLIVGERDRLVPTGPAHAFAREAREARVDVQLVSVPYAGHAFDFLSGSINNQLTRNMTMRLLAEHGIAP